MDLGTLTASLLVDTSALEQAKMEFLKFEKASTASMLAVQAKLDTVSKNFRSFGMYTSMYITAPLALAGGAAFKMAKSFEMSMQEIVGLVGMSQKQVDEWSAQIIEMAPKLGRSPKELADALYFVTSSGFKSAEAMEIVMQSAKGASAGLGDTKKIADLTTSAMNAYKDSALSAANVMDILTAAVREGKGEASQFASEMGEVIPVAARMGVTFSEVASGMAAMTLTGSTVEETATYMRQILVSLLDATPKAENALKQMGTSSANLRKEIRDKGLLSALSTLNDLTKKYGEEMMGKVFGNIRALTGVLSLMGDRLEDNRTLFKEVANSTGDMNTAFEVAAKTMSFRYNQAISAGESAMISFGKSMKGVIEPILGAIVLRLQNLVVWWNSLNTQTQQSIIKFAGFLAIIGPLALTISAVAKAFSFLVMVGTQVIKFFTAFRLAVLSNPLLAGGILLGVLTAYAVYLAAIGNSADDAADKHKKFNDEIERGRQLMEDTSPIQKRMAVLHTLSKSQVQDLKTSIEQQLKMEEDFSTDLGAELQNRIAADQKLKSLYVDLQNEKQNILKASILRQIQLRKEELATELNAEYLNSQARIKQLTAFQKTVEKKLETMSTVNPSGGFTELQKALLDIDSTMQSATQYIQKMSEAQKQLGVDFDSNAELLKVYEKTLDSYLKLVDVADPRVQKLIKQMQELNDAMLIKNMTSDKSQLSFEITTDTSEFTEGKGKAVTDAMQKHYENTKEAIKAAEQAAKDFQKQLAYVAYENAVVSDSWDYSEGQRQYDLMTAKLQVYRQEMQRLFDLQQANKDAGVSNSSVDTQLAASTEYVKELQNQLSVLEAQQYIIDNMGWAFSRLGSAIGGSAGEWLNFIGSIINEVPQILKFLNALAIATSGQTVKTAAQAVATTTQTGANIALATSAGASIAPIWGQTAAMMALAAAYTSAAVAGAAAAAAWIPFPGNLAAIPASIGAMTAALTAGIAAAQAAVIGGANIAAFMADGGVVPEGYPNDSYPAMLTSGEMVTPPGKLPMAVGTQENGMQGEVVFKISGDELRGILRKMDRTNQLV